MVAKMNNNLRRTIRQILLAGTTAAFTTGALAAVIPTLGPQNPPPGPGQIPDYFGITGNFANSPQPVLTKVVINAGVASGGISGSGASATPTTNAQGGISGYISLVGGTGYVAPQVTITDIGTGTGFSGTVTIPLVPLVNDPTPTGITADKITINSQGQYYSPNAQVVFSDPGVNGKKGSGAAGTVIINPTTGAITGINITSPGSGYSTRTTISVIDAPSGTGATATATVSGGVITKLTITSPGSGYRNPVITIVDTSSSGAVGSGAVAVATTYDYPNDKPTDRVMDVQVLNGGIGYDTTATAYVIGGPGVNPVPLTPIIQNGSIIGFSEIPNPTDTSFLGLGSGFKVPLPGTGIRKFVDQLSVQPGSSTNSGLNNLGQQIPVAVPDKLTFKGSDYYEIAEVVYTQQLHSDLPPTHLRGYVQLNPNVPLDRSNPSASYMTKPQYMGPLILAQKGTPVRVKVVNLLPILDTKTYPPNVIASKTLTGDPNSKDPANLPFPVDTTYMGQEGLYDTQNSTAVHLHGGNTPWISDGTARQWVKPLGQGLGAYQPFTDSGGPALSSPNGSINGGANKGISARSVPDMWYNKTTGNIIPSCAGQITCAVANATNDVDGQLTYFYTNEQSARLMFYHDHAEGITRLNVYAGLAAPYLLQDPTEQALVNNGTLPGLADTIPIVIQDKTFVPDATTPVMNMWGPFASALQSQDPTWRWGTGTAAPGSNGNGDLWVPHVFMTNQNPGDTTGANNMGRWDYGMWFWPPIINIQNGQMSNPYYDPSCVTATSVIGFCEPKYIPGVPNGSLPAPYLSNGLLYTWPTPPSTAKPTATLPNAVPGGVFDTSTKKTTFSPTGTPEAFNDTPVVNGTAYPFVNVDPKKYRFRILSVADDRMQNLSLVVAASNKSVDTTAQGNAGTVNNTILCDGSNGVSDYNKLPGQSPECTEVKMVPWNITQDSILPFPTGDGVTWNGWYTLQKGGVTFDGRPSGVFDPRTRGPAMIQIGSDGGFLSHPVVIHNQPVNYEYNTKNILILNVKEKALFLGPAERADVLVNFSNFAGARQEALIR
jgi:FtsP/CotA-like multicopper oxidase with cupredoxin domain